MYSYTKVKGHILSDVITLPLFKLLLEYCDLFWKKAELEFDTKKIAQIKRKAFELQSIVKTINKKLRKAKLIENTNKDKINELKIKANYDIKSAMARELIKKAEEIKSNVASDMKKVRNLKQKIANNPSSVNNKLKTKIIKLEAKAIAATRNANELKEKAEMDIKVANDNKIKAQVNLFSKRANELKDRSEETAKKAMEIKIKAELESNPSKVKALKAEAEELKKRSEIESKRAETIRQKAKDEIILSQFTNVGCFKDDWNRVIPKYTRKVKSVTECAKIARGANANLFGIQDNGDCYIGNETGKQNYKKHGRRYDCGTLGRPWGQQTYLSNDILREINKYKADTNSKKNDSQELRCKPRN
jgi:chromosome segregation ATPase